MFEYVVDMATKQIVHMVDDRKEKLGRALYQHVVNDAAAINHAYLESEVEALDRGLEQYRRPIAYFVEMGAFDDLSPWVRAEHQRAFESALNLKEEMVMLLAKDQQPK